MSEHLQRRASAAPGSTAPVSHANPRPHPLDPAGVRVIRSDAEAIAVAQALAADFAQSAAERDRERRLPWDELDRYTASGLGGISVPKEYGGAGVSHATL
ncbi:MAG TPA: acyl-CoA dehydrogenase family protein, partial [Pseudomonas sp.]|nr:acyl-CoA dehydrogenase family protein [Pseudomonas sp.]